MNSDPTAEDGSRVDPSRLWRGPLITIDPDLIASHDADARRSRNAARRSVFIAAFLTSASVPLFTNGNTIIAIVLIVSATILVPISLLQRNTAQTEVFASGRLVPGLISGTEPLRIAALVDAPDGAAAEDRFACRTFSIETLPIHAHVVGERVPCIAAPGCSRGGTDAATDIRPLAWATRSAAEIAANIARINPAEWDRLAQMASTCPEDRDIALRDADGSLRPPCPDEPDVP